MNPRKLLHSFSARLSLFILLFTAAIFVVAFTVFYHFSSRSIERAARTDAENTLQIINLKIEKVLRRVEAIPDNLNWVISSGKIQPDAMYNITKNVVRANPDIYGSAIAFEPYFFKEKGYYYSPYSYRDGDTIRSLQLGNEDYDYFTWEWYSKPKELGAPSWSEPYYDEGGGQMVMCTYSAPIFAQNGKMIGIFTSDISLEWLTDMIDNMKYSNQSYPFMLGKDGTFIIHHTRERILNQTIFDIIDKGHNLDVKLLGEKMLAGENGMMLLNDDGVESYVFYTPVPHTQWSLGIVVPSKEVFGDLHRINWMLIFIIGSGLIVMFFVSFQMISNLTKLQRTTAVKEKIESELRIAHDIQMGMLPKIFPPFPNRQEVDLYAVLNPAKEVGGDLYDFFIDDKKLYFAIGDVSGKGVPASLLMAVTLSLFRTIAAKMENPAQVMDALNAAISENNESNMFVTLFIGTIDLSTGSIAFCNAGHNPPIIATPDNNCQWIDAKPNLPIGIMKEFRYQEQTTTLPCCGTLLLYTDGVTEAENANKCLYGEKRLMEMIKNNTSCAPQQLVQKLISDIETHVKENEPSDDITLMAIQRGDDCGCNENVETQDCRGKARLTPTLAISNTLDELPKIAEFIEQIGEEMNLPMALVMNINLAVEEAVVNVINYGYEKGEDDCGRTAAELQFESDKEKIELTASWSEEELVLSLSDNGIAFDPTLNKEPDITLSAEERPIGGLGIFLVKQIMDTVEYKRENGRNILTMSKKILTKKLLT
jgi:sigma-B regulation protein RsbU (phosphoserine phosphatase)